MNRVAGISIGGVAALATAAAFATYLNRPWPISTVLAPAVAPDSIAAVTPPPAAPAGAAPAPSFDAVRVGPEGQAVLAGRAAPGAEVTVGEDGRVIGRATADDNGEWVLLPAAPLATGPHELQLSARLPGAGAPPGAAPGSLAVLVPDRSQGHAAEGSTTPPVALLLPPAGGGPPRALQPPTRRAPHDVTLDVLQYDPDGKLGLAGRADANARVQIWLDDRPAGSATADAQGQWTAQLGDAVPLGRYRLRMEALGPDGKVTGRLALPLQRDPPPAVGAAAYTVQPGNSLWRIARRSYGAGTEYIEIYRANQRQISNPNRIFPGQVLAVPPRR